MNATDLFPPGKSATPPDQMDAAMARIRVVWNECIRKRRFLKWTHTRIRDARATLRAWTKDQVVAGIRCYSKSSWQRKNSKWLAIDKWLVLSKATEWIEEAGRQAEDAESRKRAADSRVAQAIDETAQKMRLKSADELLLMEFDNMPEAYQETIFAQANDELVEVGGRRKPPKLLNLDTFLIRKHVLMILRRGVQT